ncbi:MAG: ribonuclease HIII [Simkaniaceae bacterium]|nr:ribonuclease HIII [Simkaniaceae bacterium]
MANCHNISPACPSSHRLFFLSCVKVVDMKPSCFVAKIDTSLSEKLRHDLLGQGFTFTKPPYTIFVAKKGTVSLALYESGKLTVQGKGKDEFIEFYLEPEILGSFEYSHPTIDKTPRIGVDEAGKGDFFGPLCIAGVYCSDVQKLLDIGVRDSKSMTDPAILKLAEKIRKCCEYNVIILRPAKYNELYAKFRNLNSLLGWGHASTIAELSAKTGCKTALIDQFASEHVVENALKQKGIEIDLTQRHKGESDPVVAAASILARTAFVNEMDALSEKYGMKIPKGASAAVKQAARSLISRHGREALLQICKTHFKTYAEIS